MVNGGLHFFFISTMLTSCLSLESNVCLNHEALTHNGHYLLTKIIPCDYMKDVLPPRNSNIPLKVEFNLIIHDINSINAADMDFRVDMILHMMWTDSRLNLTMLQSEFDTDHIILPSYAINYIWIPDPYITNSKSADITSFTKDFASLALFSNSSLMYSARFFSIIGCQMEFHQYPRDIQNCSVVFQSFKYSSDEVAFVWKKGTSVVLNEELKLLQFALKEPLLQLEVNSSGPTSITFGKMSQGLVVILEFQREIGHHLVQTFVPSFLLVALSWFSFWMGLDAIPGRVTLLVTSLLTLTTIFTGIQDHLPPVAYVKAIDIWMGGCMVFIFAALGEFVIVKVLKEAHKQNKVNPSTVRKNPNGLGSQFLQMFDTEMGPATPSTVSSNGKMKMYNGGPPAPLKPEQITRARGIALRWFDYRTGREKLLHEEIDKVSRLLFPFMFLLFGLIYFPILISRSF